jgi:CheY-like chemotaxis protein
VVEQRRILIVDDDPAVLLILRTSLERMRHSCQIVTARNGAEALRQTAAQPVDLIITDVRMPGIDGIELVKKLRALGSDTEVIWITAYGCGGLEEESNLLDVFRCLDKPLRIGAIRHAFKDALGMK